MVTILLITFLIDIGNHLLHTLSHESNKGSEINS